MAPGPLDNLELRSEGDVGITLREPLRGRPCVRGLRITAGLVVNLVANGMTTKEIIVEYPALEEDDIRQCLQYAAHLAEHREVELAISR